MTARGLLSARGSLTAGVMHAGRRMCAMPDHMLWLMTGERLALLRRWEGFVVCLCAPVMATWESTKRASLLRFLRWHFAGRLREVQSPVPVVSGTARLPCAFLVLLRFALCSLPVFCTAAELRVRLESH